MNVNFNVDADHIDIPNSKGKLVFLLIGSLLFVAGGIWFINNPSAFKNSGLYYRPNWETIAIGYTSVIFFGLCAITFIYVFFNNKPGLVINTDGIIISPMVSEKIVKWSDIEKFDIIDIARTRIIMIYIKNPEEYIEHQKSWARRKLLQFNYKRYGALLSISTSALKCDFDELYAFLNDSLNNYKEDSKKYSLKE